MAIRYAQTFRSSEWINKAPFPLKLSARRKKYPPVSGMWLKARLKDLFQRIEGSKS